MLILLSFADRRRRRVRAAWMAAFVCGVCLERLSALHGPSAADPAAPSAWVHDGPPPPVTTAFSPNHARFASQRKSDDASLGDQSTLHLPGNLLGAELPADFPYAQR